MEKTTWNILCIMYVSCVELIFIKTLYSRDIMSVYKPEKKVHFNKCNGVYISSFSFSIKI